MRPTTCDDLLEWLLGSDTEQRSLTTQKAYGDRPKQTTCHSDILKVGGAHTTQPKVVTENNRACEGVSKKTKWQKNTNHPNTKEHEKNYSKATQSAIGANEPQQQKQTTSSK